jgi:hypothetical protein
MSGILYLNADDFTIKKGEKGNVLCLNYEVQGLSLVLFYSNECEHCTKLLTRYKQLPLSINGCQFSMININKVSNRKIVDLSNKTIAPITYVPDIILYVDGIPYMRYDGDHDVMNIRKFIVDVYQQLQKTVFIEPQQQRQPQQQQQQQQQQQRQKQPQQPRAQQQQQKENSIPAYTIGKPKCNSDRDDVCYLSFNKAYTSTTESHPGMQQNQARAMPFYNNNST